MRSLVVFRVFIFLAFVAVLASQTATPPRLENTGKPMAIEGRCTAESIHEIGLACTIEEPCPIYLELADVQAVGDRLIISGNLHTNTSTLESILLVSDDAGKSWIEAHPRLPTSVLDRIQFYDFEVGWINGHVLHPLPRDAFFLITSDGGKTWRKRAIFGESRPGAIEQYWFDSRTHGLFLIERADSDDGLKHELWESNTGGDSWNVRQVDSKPIPMSRPAVSEPWRIRADSATKSNRIERQIGAKWESVASFRVAAGECKPAPPVESQPPPEPEPAAQPSKPSTPKPAKKSPPSLKPKGDR